VTIILVQSALARAPVGHDEYHAGVQLMNSGEEFAATEQFRKSMELGYPDAFSAMGFFCSNGRGGVEKDDAKAFEFFQKGADLGSHAAQVNLARVYLDGRGVYFDREKGLALMEAAASAGSEDAHAALAEIYFLGLYEETSKPDFQKALPHVEASAKSGNNASINMLGVMYREGHYVEKDSMRAEELFRKAAMQGNFKAQTNLAELIDPSSKKRGKRIEAAAWYIIASRQGEPMAVYQTENLQNSFNKKEFEEAKALADKFEAQIQSK